MAHPAQPVIYEGVRYPSFSAVDRAHGWYPGRFRAAYRGGHEDRIGRRGVSVGDQTFPTYAAAAEAKGVSTGYLWRMVRDGRADEIGQHPRCGTKKARKRLARTEEKRS